jgi:hypothetical protein
MLKLFKFWNLILLFAATLSTAIAVKGQTVIYSENFNGPTHTWSLNTTDAGSVASPNVPQNIFNYWIVNNIYNGGGGELPCTFMGLPLPGVTYTFSNTPTQPAGITGGPTSNYMHITAVGSPLNAGYLGPDGLCVTPQNHFTRMSNDISTIGFDVVNVKFWWMGTGASNSYMKMFYSVNQGATWTQVQFPTPTHFTQNSQWIEETVSIPQFANQANLRIGFRLDNGANNTPFPGPSIGYSIDDFRIEGSTLTQNTITTGTINPSSYCPGQTVNVPFTISGDFNAGNVFTAQLSNATGSFAAPTNIGTLASTTGGTIAATIPMGTPAGTQYRIRVVSNNPTVTGTDNGVNIVVLGSPISGNATANPITVCPNGTTTLTLAGHSGSIQWQQSSNGVNYTDIAGATNPTFNSGSLTQTTYFRAVITNACGSVESATLIINIADAIQTDISMNPSSGSLCTGQVQLSVVGNFANFNWSNGQTGNTITVTQPGLYCGEGTDVSGCPVIANCVTVNPANPQPISITPAGDVIICNGNLTLSASPGFVSYAWSNGGTGSSIVVTQPGIYTVTGTDAEGCTSTSEAVNAEVGNTVVLNVNPPNPAICSGQPVTLTAAPGFASYEWSNGQTGASITVSQPGVYSVTAVDPGGCNGVSPPISVLFGQNPIANFNYTQTSGFTANFNNTTQNASNFTWDFAGLGTSSATNPSFTFPSTGIYNVSLLSNNQCGENAITKVVSISAVGIGELENIAQIAVFPNPVNTSMQLVFEFNRHGNLVFEVYSISGQKVSSEIFSGNGFQQHSIEMSHLRSGMYILRFVSGNSVSHARIIKQ